MKPSRRLPSDFSVNAAYPLYAIDLARDRAWVLHFNRDDYLRASFLDQRALQHRPVSGWTVSGGELTEALQPPPSFARQYWLFHIGHCGSTLVSRLLDLIPGTLGLREPLPLLTLAHERQRPTARIWLSRTQALLARGFADTQAVVVKPTSVVTSLADLLLPGTGGACLLWVDLRTWLATMLRNDDLTNATLATEAQRLGLNDHSPAEARGARLARLWVAEQLRWSRLAESGDLAPRLFDLDFAEVLDDPAASIGRLANHFGLETPVDLQERIAASGILDRYAKSTSQPFDARTRQRELTLAIERNSTAVAEGLRWASEELARKGAWALESRLQRER